MNRRQFVFLAAGTAAGAAVGAATARVAAAGGVSRAASKARTSGMAPVPALPPRRLTRLPTVAHHPTRLGRIGLELYAVRNAMRKDPVATLSAIGAIGYDAVELLWSFRNFGLSVAETASALRAAGLRAPSAHMAPETILNDWEKRLEEAKELGHEYLVVPSLPGETNRSIDAWKVWAERFNRAGEVARKAGIWLAFHNEPGHQKPIDGQVPIEVFLEETDPRCVRFQLDTGNMLMGGADPLEFLRRHESRCHSFHLKNVTADQKSDTELANGAYNLGVFLAAVRDLDSKHCFVEQEGPSDELRSAKENYGYLKSLDF